MLTPLLFQEILKFAIKEEGGKTAWDEESKEKEVEESDLKSNSGV